MHRWKRSIRTAASERFVAMRGHRAVATVDVHYVADGRVVGMVVLDRNAGWTEEQVPDLLAGLNDDLLPGVDLAKGTLSLMVVIGEVMGTGRAESNLRSSGKSVRRRAAEA
jgi:hypothetical protein